MINARSEASATKPAFRDPFKSRRCPNPADGFYEWQRTGKAKQHCFEVNAGELFAFAGLWVRWKDPSGQWVKSCSILTTTPNVLTSAVHDRMPVILDPDSYDLWLDPGMSDVSAVSELLKPYDARLMRCYPISADQSRGERRRGIGKPTNGQVDIRGPYNGRRRLLRKILDAHSVSPLSNRELQVVRCLQDRTLNAVRNDELTIHFAQLPVNSR